MASLKENSEERMQRMFHALRVAFEEEEQQNGKITEVLIHPDLYDYLLVKLIESHGLGYIVDGRPLPYRKAIASRLPRQNIESDYSVEFKH